MAKHLWSCQCFECRPSRAMPPRSGVPVAGDPSFDRAKAAVAPLADVVVGEKRAKVRKRK